MLNASKFVRTKTTDLMIAAWHLMDDKDRIDFYKVIFIICISSIMSVLMIASILPFLTILSDPKILTDENIYSRIYIYLEFNDKFSFLIILACFSFICVFLSTATQIIRVRIANQFAIGKIETFSNRLYRGYINQPYEFYLSQNPANLMANLTAEVQQVVMNFFRPMVSILSAIMTGSMIFLFLIFFSPVITLLTTCVFGMSYYFLTVYMSDRLARLSDLRLQSNEQIFRIASESIQAIKDVKLANKQDQYIFKFERNSKNLAQAQIDSQVYQEYPSYMLQGIAFSGLLLICIVIFSTNQTETSQNAIAKILPILGTFGIAGMRLIPEMQKIYQGVAQLKFSAYGMQVFKQHLKLDQAKKVGQTQDNAKLQYTNSLQLKNIEYRHAENKTSLSLNLTINKGENIGIIGKSGAGKTTLINLIMGLISPNKGNLIVDNTTIDHTNLRNWQNNVAYVPQDVFVINGTIAENINFLSVSQQRDTQTLDKIVKLVGLDNVLSRSDLGYNALLGENGIDLSGGEKQRVGIARALTREADILILDEATSALDTELETQILDEVLKQNKDKTIIMIAHRINTLKYCNRILELNSGKLVQELTYEELIGK